MIGTEVETVSLRKASHLEKANHVLEKFIQYATHQGEAAKFPVLQQEGIFRLSGNSGQIDKLFSKFDKDPSRLSFDSEQDFILEPNNITGFLKRYLLSPNLRWSDSAAAILRAELQRDTQNYDFVKIIQQLIANNHLEEAKMLHNLLHISQLVSARAATNKMTVSNMFQTFSPTLVNMAQGDDPLAAKLALGAIVATKSNIDTMGISKSDINGQAYFGRSFNETHPEIAAQIDQKHKEQFGQKPGRGTRLSSLMQTTNDYVRNTAFPAVRNFFKNTLPNFITKTVPSFFKRLMGSKAKETLPDKMTIPPELLAAKQQAEAARAAKGKEWQAGKDPQADRSNSVIMGYNRPPDLGAPPLPPDPSETSPKAVESQRPHTLTQEEAEAAKQAREMGYKHFRELESGAVANRPPVPPRKIMSKVEQAGAKQATEEGLKRFQGLEAKGAIPPRPVTPPRERPLVAPRERPAVPPRKAQTPASEKREKPVPPPKENKPKSGK